KSIARDKSSSPHKAWFKNDITMIDFWTRYRGPHYDARIVPTKPDSRCHWSCGQVAQRHQRIPERTIGIRLVFIGKLQRICQVNHRWSPPTVIFCVRRLECSLVGYWNTVP